MHTGRHRVIVDTSERFAQAAQRAARQGQPGRAALLYRAAVMVLDGRSLDEVELLLEDLYDTDGGPFPSG